MSEEKKHYFNLSFISQTDNGTRYTNRIVSSSVKFINADGISSTKESNGLPEDAALMGVSYLGHMTVEEFEPAK